MQIGELTVSDIWGPANTEGPNQERYFYLFMDAKTGCTQIYISVTQRQKYYDTSKNTKHCSRIKPITSLNDSDPTAVANI